MSEPFLGEIRLFSFSFAPKGWAMCNGQILPIAQNQALFALMGTTYGGDGVRTFALPNLQGSVPLHLSASYPQGMRAGEASHTLTSAEMPAHSHAVQASDIVGTSNIPGNTLGLARRTAEIYHAPTNLVALSVFPAGPTVSNSGGNQAHTNLQPFLVMNFCVATVGIFPSRN